MLIELAASLLLSPGPIVAPVPVVTRIRPLSGPARVVLEEAVRKSPTIARLIAELYRHDVIVYLDFESMMGARGSTSLVVATGQARFLRIVVSTRLDPRQQIEVLGHELQHAIEIARAGEVVDIASFQAFFDRIGYPTGRASFETDAAKRVEHDVRAEISKLDDPPLT